MIPMTLIESKLKLNVMMGLFLKSLIYVCKFNLCVQFIFKAKKYISFVLQTEGYDMKEK